MEKNLSQLISSQVNSYHLYNNDFCLESLARVSYVLAADGLYRVECTPVAHFWSRIETFSSLVPGLSQATPGPVLQIPKVPFHLLQQVFSFYQDVYQGFGTEASALFFYNHNELSLPEEIESSRNVIQEGRVVVYVPNQINSPYLSVFKDDPHLAWFHLHMTRLCETHSHHSMEAYFSNTDDANETSTQFYGVFGRINTDKPMFAFRYCSGDTKQLLTPDLLFEWPQVETRITVTGLHSPDEQSEHISFETSLYHGPVPRIDYPMSWFFECHNIPEQQEPIV